MWHVHTCNFIWFLGSPIQYRILNTELFVWSRLHWAWAPTQVWRYAALRATPPPLLGTNIARFIFIIFRMIQREIIWIGECVMCFVLLPGCTIILLVKQSTYYYCQLVQTTSFRTQLSFFSQGGSLGAAATPPMSPARGDFISSFPQLRSR